MRGAKLLSHVRQALANLNPGDVRTAAAVPVRIVIDPPDARVRTEVERVLIPDNVTARKQAAARSAIGPSEDAVAIRVARAAAPGTIGTPGLFLYTEHPRTLLPDILAAHPDLHLALARTFPGFRERVAKDLILTIAQENATFALATSLPAVVPYIPLPVAIDAFASDTAFLTMNQIRMAFLLAAASGHEVGYREQKTEIASIIASAFGWRGLARELVRHVPLGGGVLPKVAIAFAGTYVEGASLERMYRLGYGYSPTERERAYRAALERGKVIASTMIGAYRRRRTSPLQ